MSKRKGKVKEQEKEKEKEKEQEQEQEKEKEKTIMWAPRTTTKQKKRKVQQSTLANNSGHHELLVVVDLLTALFFSVTEIFAELIPRVKITVDSSDWSKFYELYFDWSIFFKWTTCSKKW